MKMLVAFHLIASLTFGGVLTASADVLFEEHFDNANFSARGWYDNTSLVLSTVEHIPGSSASAAFRFPHGAQTPTSGGSIRRKFSDTDALYVSFYIKYSSNWTGSNRAYHPHQFMILTNLNGDWDGLSYDYLTAYIEDNEGTPLFAIQDSQNIDVTKIGRNLVGITENRAVAGCNGDSDGYGNGDCYASGSQQRNGKAWRAGQVYFQDSPGKYYKNDWHHIEVFMKLNSVVNNTGVADGKVQYWYDGEPVFSYTDVVMRTAQRSAMKFNKFIIAPWIGDGSPVDQTFWVDELVVGDSLPRLPAPTDLRVVH